MEEEAEYGRVVFGVGDMRQECGSDNIPTVEVPWFSPGCSGRLIIYIFMQRKIDI